MKRRLADIGGRPLPAVINILLAQCRGIGGVAAGIRRPMSGRKTRAKRPLPISSIL